jgi:hypothetical protein
MLELRLGGEHPGGWIDSPPMIGIHLWRHGQGLVSHVVAVDEATRYAAFAASHA